MKLGATGGGLVRRRSAAALLAVGAVLTGGAPALAGPASGQATVPLPRQLATAVTVDNVNGHLIQLQRIADRNGGNRAAQSAGYRESVDYLVEQLTAAGFDVVRSPFSYETEVADARTLRVGGVSYTVDAFEFSPQTPAGGLTSPLAVVPEDVTTGCEAADFAGANYVGTIALIRRGGCTFAVKQQNAAAAGAIAAIISNNTGGTTLINGTLGEGSGVIPTGDISQNDGTTLAGQAGAATTLDLRSHIETVTEENVVAQTRTGRTDRVVLAGAHLDSVAAGAGINDNGTGSATLLEIARQLGPEPRVRNAVRFAWWGAEELGLIGSTQYVAGLTSDEQLDIQLYLNFDMVGSPNAAYFVYDGDDSDGVGAGPGPAGSAQIEADLIEALRRVGVTSQGTDFSGRSDYGPFIEIGIPAGGLFTGAEGIKTEEQADLWGGVAGAPYDACYHQACDNLGNIDRTALDRNADAAAAVIATYAVARNRLFPARSPLVFSGGSGAPTA